MARNCIEIAAPPTAVWSTLADPHAYPEWVVGADRTLEADEHWPQRGARFKVHLGLGIKDHTTVRDVVPGKSIVLDAAASYLGPARVSIDLTPSRDGTEVTMIEDPAGKFFALRYL